MYYLLHDGYEARAMRLTNYSWSEYLACCGTFDLHLKVGSCQLDDDPRARTRPYKARAPIATALAKANTVSRRRSGLPESDKDA